MKNLIIFLVRTYIAKMLAHDIPLHPQAACVEAALHPSRLGRDPTAEAVVAGSAAAAAAQGCDLRAGARRRARGGWSGSPAAPSHHGVLKSCSDDLDDFWKFPMTLETSEYYRRVCLRMGDTSK